MSSVFVLLTATKATSLHPNGTGAIGLPNNAQFKITFAFFILCAQRTARTLMLYLCIAQSHLDVNNMKLDITAAAVSTHSAISGGIF